MLMDLTKALAPGDTVTLTLTLEGAGTVTVDAEVREQ
jgi:copper(I)-binding protein